MKTTTSTVVVMTMCVASHRQLILVNLNWHSANKVEVTKTTIKKLLYVAQMQGFQVIWRRSSIHSQLALYYNPVTMHFKKLVA